MGIGCVGHCLSDVEVIRLKKFNRDMDLSPIPGVHRDRSGYVWDDKVGGYVLYSYATVILYCRPYDGDIIIDPVWGGYSRTTMNAIVGFYNNVARFHGHKVYTRDINGELHEYNGNMCKKMWEGFFD